MGVAERREREKRALRQEILAAAREVFAREGYESVSMRKIADKIEYSPTTIYLYFHDKREIIKELCDEMFALLSKKLDKVMQAVEDPVERLKAGLRVYIEFGLKHPDHYRVTLMTRREHSESCEEFRTSSGAQTFQRLVETVAACVEAGRFREKDVMLISQSLWMTIHGVTALWITTEGYAFPWVDRDRLIDFTIETAVGGLLR